MKQSIIKITILGTLATIAIAGLFLFFGAAVDFGTRPLAVFANGARETRTRLYGMFQPMRLQQQFDTIQDRVIALEQQLVDLEALRVENERLRALLELPDRSEHTLIETNVVGYDPLSQQTRITIIGGSDKNLVKGMGVINGDGVFIGRITEVFGHRSSVRLITDTNSSVTAHIRDTDTFGLITGRHGVGLLFERIAVESQIEPGDVVVTGSQDPLIPADLIIGRVLAVEDIQGQTFKQARTTPAFDPKTLDRLFVIYLTQDNQ